MISQTPYSEDMRTAARVVATTVDIDLIPQSLASATIASVEVDGLIPDAQLPEALRGKGLVGGKPVAVWPLGLSSARDGRIFLVDSKAVESLLADGNSQIVPFTFNHEDDPVHGADTSGYALHWSVLGDFIVADRIAWTQTAAAKIRTGQRGFVSPDAYCEPLDPESYSVLPANSKTNTFRPRFWRATSLVGVPALKNLPPASLKAHESLRSKGAYEMSPKLMKLCGLPADASQKVQNEALASLRTKLGLPTEATERQILAAATSFDRETVLAILRQTFKIPDVVSDEMLSDMLKAAMEGAEASTDTGVEAEVADAAGKKSADGFPAEKAIPAAAALKAAEQAGANAATAAVRSALPKIVDDVRAEMRAKDRAEAIDRELASAEKEGRLVPAERESFRRFMEIDETLARRTLAARGTGATIPTGTISISGGFLDQSVSVDSLPLRESSEILSRSAAWAYQTGVEFPIALRAVRGQDKDEGAFHSQVLAANPDWAEQLSGEKPQRSGRRGLKWPVVLRRGLSSVELDRDLIKHIGTQMKMGAIPTNLIPAEVQTMALQRMSLAGEVASFQPPTRFPVPGFAFGYFQGEYGGSEIAPDVAGGANEEASYPIYSTEKLSVKVNAAGLPEPVGRNAEDIDTSYWGADWKKVTLHGYGNRVWADRRDQVAGDSVLPEGVMATVTAQALTVEKNKKELLQAATIRAIASYNALNYIALTGDRQWNNPASTPIQDWQGARIAIWRATGAFPDISLVPPDVIETLKFHKDFLVAAQFAGMGDASRPNAMVPIEMLVSILGPIVVPTCRISTSPGGVNPSGPWGQDVVMAVTGKGKVIAPRAFATVSSAGYPLVRGMVDEKRGLNGSDGVAVSDMYTVEIVGAANPSTTQAAFLFQNATPELAVIA